MNANDNVKHDYAQMYDDVSAFIETNTDESKQRLAIAQRKAILRRMKQQKVLETEQ